jgi:hypothetical protein
MDEIVYTETRPGVMETSGETREREERNLRRLDSLGRWIFPAMFAFLAVGNWLFK